VKNQPPTINIFEKAAKKAGKGLIRDFGEIENLQIQSKSLGDFVTNSDLKSEKKLLELLTYYYPNYSFIMEEKGKIEGKEDETIVIDPLDGTTNFIHGIPIFGIVIAKISKSEITDGVIFNPITNEFFWASKGLGAWCNNTRLRVSKRDSITECVIGTGIPHLDRIYDGYLKEIDQLSKKCSGLRRMGSAALDLAYVAAGKLDAFWERNLNLWDIAAGALLVKEAGGKVTEPIGDPWSIESKDILASNTKIHNEVQQSLIIK
jgi:myo-inositol-1(or 4)-monophosphatase